MKISREWSTIWVDYYLAPGYGRLLSRGPSGQKLTREARQVAFEHLLEVDAPCCHPRLLRLRLQKLSLWDEIAYPMVELFCSHYKKWRSALASYMEVQVEVAKKELIRIFYGGMPSIDIPWLRKLGEEVQRAAHAILAHESSARWVYMYTDRANPEFSRLSAILSFDEASLLDLFRAEPGVQLEVALFDGAYLQCQTMADKVRIQYCCQEAARKLIPIEIKSAPTSCPGFIQLLLQEQTVDIAPCSTMCTHFENCLLNALQSVQPSLDLSGLIDQVQATPGTGLSAHDFNAAALFGSQRSVPVHQLQFVEGSVLLASDLTSIGSVLCHEWLDVDEGHWWAFVADNGFIKVYDSLAHGFVLTVDMATFEKLTRATNALSFFTLVEVETSAVLPEGFAYHLRGKTCTTITTPLSACSICSAPLMDAETVPATIYTLEGALSVEHKRKRCTQRSCRVRHSYNYVQTGKCKLNCLHPDDAEYILVTTQTGFSKSFLKYHDALQFRGFLSMAAISWAQDQVILDDEARQAIWEKSYACARLLLNVMSECAEMWQALPRATLLQKLKSIDVETPLTHSLLGEYRQWFLRSSMSPKEKSLVTAVCMDGHEKIAVKCMGTPPSRGGRPRKDGTVRPFNNGWFMICSPETGFILSVVEMVEPESNKIALSALEELLQHFPHVNLVIYDRACAINTLAKKKAGVDSIRYWAVDKFHAKGHIDACPCHPERVRSLKKQLKGLNTSLSEQVFSWFRGYANTFNSMSAETHKFYVLAYSRRRNVMTSKKDTAHLNVHAAAKKAAQANRLYKRPASYAYTCKRPAASLAVTSSSSSSCKRPAWAR